MAMLQGSKHLRSLAVLLLAILCGALQTRAALCAQNPPPGATSTNDILGQLNNSLAQEASTRAALARELALYAETVRMRVVRGALGQAAADSALRQRAREMAQRGMSIQDQQALRAEQQKEAALYFRYIERTVSRNAHWPSGDPVAAYLAEANRLMARARQSYRQAIAQNRDPDFSLAMAYWVLRLASGDANAVISATPFDSREGGIQAGPAPPPPGAQSNQPPAPVATLPTAMPKATAIAPLGHPTGGSIGIRIKDGTVAGKPAVLIVEVHPGSAGAAVGLRAGDIIVSLEHKPVAHARALHQSVQAFQPGQVVALGVVRAGEPLNVRVKLSAPLPAAAVPRGGANAIQVLAGTYGGNCPAQEFSTGRGNVTSKLSEACDGKTTCGYVVDYRVLGDPSVGCAKTYVAEWTCGDSGRVRRAEAAAEAGYGSTVELTCEATGKLQRAR
ncbi:MAG: PDZ domain-containing protein [Alphaproteobacteria bacterium]|nr:PDZ domain-containing protein [Alphaproteobacteria bacterium]MDE2631214.1 PDZ domain-containing protein [Alphaproteobacteria bacterium]